MKPNDEIKRQAMSVMDEGEPNISLDFGTFSLWFQANWTSTTDGGNGPTNWATMLSVGNWTSNAAESAWTIAISPSGTNLVMEAQSSGSNQVVFDVPIDFDAGDWHSIAVTYSLSSCCVYMEGLLVTNTGPIKYFPSESDCTNYGLFVGSLSTNGECQAHGQFQDLQTYDGPLSADMIAQEYADTAAIILNRGGTLPSGGFSPDDEPPTPEGGTNSGSGGGGGSPDIPQNPGTNLWLIISLQSNSVLVTLTNTVAGSNYLLLVANSLTGPWFTNQSLLATTNTAVAEPIPTSDDSTVFFVGKRAAPPVPGTLKWSVSLGGPGNTFDPLSASPAIGPDGTVYIPSTATTSSMLFAIDPLTGKVKWSNNIYIPDDSPQSPELTGSATIGTNGMIYIGSDDNHLYSFYPSGATNWVCNLGHNTAVYSTPAIGSNGTIYVTTDETEAGADSTNSGVLSINTNGTINWKFVPQDQLDGHFGDVDSSPAVASDGTVYFGCWDDNLYAVTNGSPAWTFSTGGVIDSAPAIGANGTVYFGSYDQTLYAVTNGSQAWAFTTGGEIVSSPAIGADGTVYVASTDGNLYAIFGSTPLATNEPWPMFHQNPSHTGLQSPGTTPAEDCGAPFVYDGTNDGMGDFSFSIVGTAGSVWNVYASTNLTNWTKVSTNLTLVTNVDSFNGNATFTNTNVAGFSQRFYQLSNSTCTSRVIGFVNLKIAPNTNLIANQLYQVDETMLGKGPMNTLNALFLDSWGSDELETQIMTWNSQGFDAYTFYWIPGGSFWLDTSSDTINGDVALLPGIGVLMNNTTGAPFTNTFVGLVREQQVFEIQANTTNYLSATLPVAGPITNITGYVPHNGDKIQLWNTTNQAFTTYSYISNAWSNGVPTLSVGEGFVLITTNTHTWTNTWEP